MKNELSVNQLRLLLEGIEEFFGEDGYAEFTCDGEIWIKHDDEEILAKKATWEDTEWRFVDDGYEEDED